MYQNIFITKRTEFEEAMIYLWDDEDELIVAPYKKFKYAYKPSSHGKYTSMYGDKLSRIENARYGTPGLFESDVNPSTRVLTDLYLDSDIPSKNHRTLTFDIEVDSVGGFATVSKADKKITAIANHDSRTGHYTVFILDVEAHIKSYTTETETVKSFMTERGLLDAWLKFYNEMAPTIITGWNINGYDIPYVYNRLNNVYGQEAGMQLSPILKVRYNERMEKYEIAGVSCLDYILLYKKFTYIKQPSYRLDAIGQFEVEMGKVEYDGTLDNLLKTDIKKFVEYNLNDVRIVVKIDEKMRLIELARSICHTGHVPYESFEYSSRFIEGAILTYLHRKGIIAPNKPLKIEGASDNPDEVKFKGAFVKEPEPGLYQWVYSLDLQSLYPSIIMSLNISPETKVAVVNNWDIGKHINKEIKEYEIDINKNKMVMSREEITSFLKKEKLTISANGVMYSTNKIGIIPEILIEWFDLRKKFKNMMKDFINSGDTQQAEFYDRRQHVQKIFLNSVYGTLGLSTFRFFDVDNALAVTASGQHIIKTSTKAANSYYSTRIDSTQEDHVLYVDTDSLYISAIPFLDQAATSEIKKEESILLARDVERHLNEFYSPLAKRLFNCDSHRLVIKGESVMSAAFWVGKKMYALKKIYDLETNENLDGKVKPKGLAVVRSQTPPAFKTLMGELLKDILSLKQKSEIDAKILEFRKHLEELPIVMIARSSAVKNITKYEEKGNTSLSKFKKGAPKHVKAGLTYNNFLAYIKKEKFHVPLRNGDNLKYIPLRPNPLYIDNMGFKNYDDPQEVMDYINEYIDYDKAFDDELSKKIQSFYDAMHWGLIPTKMNQDASFFFDIE